MDQQRINFKSGMLRLSVLVLMTLLIIMGLTVIGLADAPTELTVDASKLVFSEESGITVTPAGVITKTYDGSAAIDKTEVSVDPTVLPAGKDLQIAVDTISWSTKDAGLVRVNVTFALSGADAGAYVVNSASYSARIAPLSLTWAAGTATATANYTVGATSYAFAAADLSDLPAIDTTGLSPALAAEVGNAIKTVTSVTPIHTATAGIYATTAAVTLSDTNFTVAAMPVSVTINKIEIVKLVWSNTEDTTYGDPKSVSATAYDAANIAYGIYTVTYPVGYENAGTHTLTAVLNNPNFSEAATLVTTKSVTVKPKSCAVSMKDLSAEGDGRTPYIIGVEGDLPSEVKAKIVYTVGGQPFNGAATAGTYVITALLPDDGNYVFTENGKAVTELSAKLTVTIDQMPVSVQSGDGKTAFDIVLTAPNGLPASVSATAVEATDVKLPDGTKYAQSFQIKFSGTVADESYTLIVPLSYQLYRKGCKDLSAESLYVYDKSGNPVAASKNGYTVTAAEGYFKIEGVKGSLGTVTFSIAPQYESGRIGASLLIPIIVLILVAILLIAMFLIGKSARRTSDRKAEEPAEEIAETQSETTAVAEEPEEEPVIEEEPEPEPVKEPVTPFAKFAIEISPEDETVIEEEFEEETVIEEEPKQEPVEEPAEEIVETQPETTAVAEEPEEETAIEEEPKQEPAEEPIVEAFAPVAVATEETEENEEAEEVENGGLIYIDTKKYPDRYREMLDIEAAGEAQILYRYRKSFQAKLSQADAKIQNYYSAIKNALLRYRGVKARKSWNYEAFNQGRFSIAKIIPKTKTIYLYLGIDPSGFEGTNYGILDVSDKKKFEATPSLLKIKGERKFKFALELIEMICGEALALKSNEKPEQDYRIPHMTTDELLEAGLIRQFAALAPLDAPPETYGRTSDED